MIRVLLADDEPIARQRLELALTCIPETQLVASAKNGREASLLIQELKPDVAILDIQMPGKDGFAVIADIEPGYYVPEIIFVTAFHEHAVRAFEIHAADYLLKPVAFERLREAIQRATARIDSRASDQRFSELQAILSSIKMSGDSAKPTYERELWARTRSGVLKLPVESIDLITAEGDYVLVHVDGATHLLKDTITSLELRLDPSVLLRVHRSAIVGLARVKSIRRRNPRGYVLVLNNGLMTDVGPSYVDTVLTAVNAKRWR
jgi:DNA-binding LytR/AlgR family response regulator